jgi:NitT/TauT family transport system permease protein
LEAVETTATPRQSLSGHLARLLKSNRTQVALFSVALFAFWEFSVVAFDVPHYLLPAPSAVLQSLHFGITSGIYISNLFVTFSQTIVGFLIAATAGILLGTLITQFAVVERLVYPYIVALQSLPKIAIAPLIIVWLGYGFSSKVVVSAMVAFFPVLVNVIAGMKSADPDQLDLMRSLKASRWQILTMVILPSALPFIFAGLNIAIIFAVLGSIVAEFVGSQAGLGHLILTYNANLDIAAVFACLILLGAMGTTLHGIMRWCEWRIVFWTRNNSIINV